MSEASCVFAVALVAFIAWFSITWRAIDRAYSRKPTPATAAATARGTGPDTAEMNGRTYRKLGSAWFDMETGEEQPTRVHLDLNRAQREWEFAAAYLPQEKRKP